MIEHARGLSARGLDALAALEQRSVAADGGRLKLEWSTLRSRPGDQVDDLLWWEGEQLLGFVGLYAFGGVDVELAGVVDPAARRKGIATALLASALPLCRERGFPRALLVTPRAPAAGHAFALRRGAALDHSEHALVLIGEPAAGPSDPALRVREATAADLPLLNHLLEEAFGFTPETVLARLGTTTARTLVAEIDGEVIGTVRVTLEAEVGGVYGFAIAPALRGRGIGRDVLRRVCQQLRAGGATRVGLEVMVHNERALGLYTSLGFGVVTTEDYYALPLR
ncbi:MAG: GCN5-related N-acetyltransferase [Labilithrix sp.]|nr:GCN5-related N-acetyltransferase [Labilithrix sp.]